MPRALLVHFSQGGTTARVAAAVGAGLAAAGWAVDRHNLRDGPPPGPAGYDLLGVGTPTHYFRPPFVVTDYLDRLPDLNGLPVLTFVLYGTYRGDAGNRVRRALARKGGREAGYFHCRGADYYLPYLKQGYLFSPDHPTPAELAAAEAFGREVAGRVAAGEFPRVPADPRPPLAYRLERAVCGRPLVRHVYSRLFRVDPDRCTGCGHCVGQCPVGNLTQDAQELPVWGRECLFCLACEMACPQDAITSPMSWALAGPAVRHNVRAAARDPDLDHVRVEHRKGRTRRLPLPVTPGSADS
jgi:flavodoxin/ferredoxin